MIKREGMGKIPHENKTGNQEFHGCRSDKMAGENPDFAQEDMCNAIEEGNFPKWTMYIQVMTEDQARDFRWNPLILLKYGFREISR